MTIAYLEDDDFDLILKLLDTARTGENAHAAYFLEIKLRKDRERQKAAARVISSVP